MINWTDEICDALKAGVADKKSFREIGKELSEKFQVEISRCAAIGKAKRLKLVIFHPEPKPKAERRVRNRSGEHHAIFKIVRMNGNSDRMRVIQTVEYSGLPLFRCVESEPRNLTLAELGDNDCRYIAGDDYLYCGHPQRGGSSYCGPHHALVWVPAAPPNRTARKYHGTDFARGAA